MNNDNTKDSFESTWEAEVPTDDAEKAGKKRVADLVAKAGESADKQQAEFSEAYAAATTEGAK